MLGENFTRIFNIFVENMGIGCGDYLDTSGNVSIAFTRNLIAGRACMGENKCVVGTSSTHSRQFSSLFMAAGMLHDLLARCILDYNREYIPGNCNEDRAYSSGFMSGLATASTVFISCCAIKMCINKLRCMRRHRRINYLPLNDDIEQGEEEDHLSPDSSIEESEEEEVLLSKSKSM
ncbi:hypothetical protein K6025_05235 [Ehrlichia sp. JZT12]